MGDKCQFICRHCLLYLTSTQEPISRSATSAGSYVKINLTLYSSPLPTFERKNYYYHMYNSSSESVTSLKYPCPWLSQRFWPHHVLHLFRLEQGVLFVYCLFFDFLQLQVTALSFLLSPVVVLFVFPQLVFLYIFQITVVTCKSVGSLYVLGKLRPWQGCIFFPKIGFFIKYYSKVLSFL